MNKTMIADIQRSRAELTTEDSIRAKVQREMRSIMDHCESFDNTPHSYDQPFARCVLDSNQAEYALVRYDSALYQLPTADDIEFVLLCQEAVKEYHEAQKLLNDVRNRFNAIKGDIEDHHLTQAYGELIEKLLAVPIDPLIQKIALGSHAHLKYVKHQHTVQFLPDSFIEVKLMYNGVRLGQAKIHWFTPASASDIVDSIIDYWPLSTWNQLATCRRGSQ